jgi:hypothetical protein
MLRTRTGWVVLGTTLAVGTLAEAQVAPPTKTVDAYSAAVEITALAPAGKAGPGAAPEAEALVGRLKSATKVTATALLSRAFTRIEITSTDFVLPAGTLVFHEAGQRHYVVADPKEKTYVVMDADALLNAIEGGAGVVNSQYQARTRHTHEQREIAGFKCYKSILEVTYGSTIPFESSSIVVQQKNNIEIWHTPSTVAAAALDHFFFKFRQDRTGEVQKVVAADIGFPLEISFIVTPAQADPKAAPQPGSFALRVTELKAGRVEPGVFQMPPVGYRRLERNPYLKSGGAGAAQ